MRHKYDTRAIVLARQPLGETTALLTLLTPGVGLVHARAQGVRRPGAKLAAACATFAENGVVLVRGREGWRVTGAVLIEDWARRLARPARSRAGRVVGLLLRLAPHDIHDSALYGIMLDLFAALTRLPLAEHEPAEVLAALRLLAALGLDAGAIPSDLAEIARDRTTYIARVNHGIEISGL